MGVGGVGLGVGGGWVEDGRELGRGIGEGWEGIQLPRLPTHATT